jgi:hypothetical protein
MRDRIIAAIRERFLDDKRVNACWLEGSDGLGTNDEYSDIDLWLDVDDGCEGAVLEDCRAALEALSPLDFDEAYDHPHPKIFQRFFHLRGTSEYLIVDLCLQSHSRGSEGCTFVEGDIAELPLILFDKAGMIRIIHPPPDDETEIGRVYQECLSQWGQRARVVKYLHRGLFLEATAYYGKYVAEQVVLMARLLHTPRHWDYGLVHLSHHVPEDLRLRLESLYRVPDLTAIRERLPEADILFAELDRDVQSRYPFLQAV